MKKLIAVSYISRISFDAAYPNKTEINLDGLVIPVIGIRELVANKLASGRAQDLVDAQQLQKNVLRKKND